MASYLLVAAADGYAAPDGSTHPAGTAFNRVVWDGSTEVEWPAGLTPVPDDGRALWVPFANLTVVSRLDFLGRFTGTELTTLAQGIVSTPALFVWYAKLSDPVDLTNPLVEQGIAALVSAGLLTQARATTILTL